MTLIYLINNNHLFNGDIIYDMEISEERKKELCPLSFKGEKFAFDLKKKFLIKKLGQSILLII